MPHDEPLTATNDEGWRHLTASLLNDIRDLVHSNARLSALLEAAHADVEGMRRMVRQVLTECDEAPFQARMFLVLLAQERRLDMARAHRRQGVFAWEGTIIELPDADDA